jgi:hypothetical protein
MSQAVSKEGTAVSDLPPERLAELTTPEEIDSHPYRDSERLREAFESADRTIQYTADQFDASYATIREWLIALDIYDPETEGISTIYHQARQANPPSDGDIGRERSEAEKE